MLHEDDEDDTEYYIDPDQEWYGDFRTRLEANLDFTDEALMAFIAEATAYPNITITESALGLIVDHKGLLPQQRRVLASNSYFTAAHLQNRLRRVTLIHDLKHGALSDALFTLCVDFKDDPVHRALLNNHSLSHSQLTILMEVGANKAVRNLAAQRLGLRRA